LSTTLSKPSIPSSFSTQIALEAIRFRSENNSIVQGGYPTVQWEREVTIEEMLQETYNKVGHDGCLVQERDGDTNKP
jgi:hypothetical protein